ncbi:MAG: TetR/AcrR family transcriptional regulator, partial [Psychrilyobacter sp.]|nr:TetR/AcrR family transcriptional regulator [Psychrilyobacter sp.]
PTSLIAKESGIATGTLFNYFKTKDILINEIFFKIKLERNTYIKEKIRKDVASKEKLRDIWTYFIIWSVENQNKDFFLEAFKQSDFIDKETMKDTRKSHQYVLDTFNELVKKEKITEESKHIIILNFIGSCTYTSKYFIFTNEKFDLKKSEESFERFCKGIDLTDED